MDELVAQIREQVEAHGYQVVLAPGDEERPSYGFTIGLTRSFGHPELVVVGLDDGDPDGAMHELLAAAADVVAEGGRFVAGTTDADLLEDHAIAVRAVAPATTAMLLDVAREVSGGDVDALQLVWPDSRGLMPWSPACDARVRARQPLLDA